jgi:diaminohydroxyphosphoribosylaminopyrimidine deaminase/5-amino-6-(5-phosphoribosylamino)uracil reductase
MRRAMRLAWLGLGRTSPNPMVGCVIVREGQVVGQGWHDYAAVHHAEVVALEQAGSFAAGADLYVTLEPCSHQGRTPPCVRAIVAAGIRRVVCGIADPNPLVSGQGIASLREAGIEVIMAPDPRPFADLNRAFFKSVTTGRPWVVIKAALTLDGKIAPLSGNSRWITGQKARRHAGLLRLACDAILVGRQTVVQDDPLLTCRHRRPRHRPLQRIVLDPRLEVPPSTQLVRTARQHPLVIVCGEEALLSRREALTEAGVTVLPLQPEAGEFSLAEVLRMLHHQGIRSVLVEGGSRTISRFITTGEADEFFFYYGPKLLGRQALPLLTDMGPLELHECPSVHIRATRLLSPDVLITGRFSNNPIIPAPARQDQ